MWTRNVVWVAVAVALLGGCGGEDEGSENPGGTGGGGAGGASGAAGTGGTGGGGTGGTGGGGAGGTGGTGGITIPECPMEPGPAMCGTNACTAVQPGLLCLKTCCAADGTCGTTNATNPMCISSANTTLCPNEMVGGQAVTGCCVDEATNECGITNIFPIGPPCVGRTSSTLAMLGTMLDAKNCDGTPVMGGAGGAGGMGGAGGGGMGGEGGMGGADPDAGM